ncbi:conserved protein of unknown function [Magnetospirillum gryphiswaldense MSR-1 v2]|uniref:6-hydroxymethylpterin diphosphokinase MptE-like domain-containing protein n=1 Tax=Magnetospirillum gryphiswaldense (strain DSM 6361 / JCM 21280 / NBRC 15271 / MSR-1) TaxID=431944 RepID=V6F5B4_MAGGM|nr:6-hydroxymethylpterin diphosphokinase MptE-like protein [Magnetospirillum gryphiswaldense]CDL00639.1 conserved protein of unknown function [Magnetospirillum gryphiswaldense MSR-1 v2]
MMEATQNGELAYKLVRRMDQITWDRVGPSIVENVHRNSKLLSQGRSLADLRHQVVGEGDSAIVIAAGPSIKRRDPLATIRESSYKGALVVTESAIAYCLRNGIVPDLCVTLDPHATRVVRWFGDPELTREKIEADDYYARQDMDEFFADQVSSNVQVLRMLDEHGPKIRIALCTSASKAVVDRVLQTGMQVYWWNPMMDDPDLPDSVTRTFYDLNGLPAVNAGGNVGSACWMMANAVLGKKHVAVTGMDLGYYGDTPYYNTQYYHEAVDLVGKENLDKLYPRFFNPHVSEWFYTDPAYLWYRECFIEMTQDPDCKTYNCTEGGCLFADHIDSIPLADFLRRHG